MNRLSTAKRAQIVGMMSEGNSLRAITRMTGVSINTVTKLLVDLGTACAAFHDEHVRGLQTTRIECDEVWTFCYARRQNVPADKKGEFGYGDVWTWVGLDVDSKLVVNWMIGGRNAETALPFMHDLASRLENRVQLTTDGLNAYLVATDAAFGTDIDYARLIKVYGADPNAERRYAPPVVIKSTTEIVSGDPDPRQISTSYIERQNLTMRMSMRRFTRLTNGHSKKVQNHGHALAIHYVHYNFGRVQKGLKGTPAMAAGIADRVWSLEDIVGLLDAAKAKGGIDMTPPGLIIRPALAAFARELRAARLHAGLSCDELAKRAGMTRQGLEKIEHGNNCQLGTIILLANALGCEVSEFFPPRKARWN